MKILSKTQVTVRLRKVEDRNEWYVYLESYPIFVAGKDEPQRSREYLNRIVRTVEWDKKRTSRTNTKNGVKSFKPKRDDNGVIICKSELDSETMLYADGIRKLRQKEYDNIDLYSESDAVKAELQEKQKEKFVDYCNRLLKKRHGSVNSSDSIRTNWKCLIEFLIEFGGENLPFSKINLSFAEDFKLYLLSAPYRGTKKGILSKNSASTYFSIFKAIVTQAFIDGYFAIDLSAKFKGIGGQESFREHLSLEELNLLVNTPCENDELRRASLFSALTGLRHCDIKRLKWKELDVQSNRIKIQFRQKKTKGVEYTPISEQAIQLCGTPRLPEQLVFENLQDSSWISRPLEKWIQAAGIKKHITFHCFRHTFATLQLTLGTDIYTVSKMLGHSKVTTTQIYTKVVDELKNRAAGAIKLNESAITQTQEIIQTN
ncbi:site-specific integrase [Chryseobacterium sp. B21-037]|uniref:site-specific integrase n=1 Tax=Chryseobacterium sp. B21-037 TaxID=2926038 RepID=UPI00235868C8|nr:site-specific integrase [Chryseobacterium sp. B21-037]MDC8105034.1 site-specific integrase [Chryseobacterium sp. B21-037]